MKWAIFEFDDSSCDVGQTSWIQGEDAENFDNESWFFDNDIIVKWPKDFNKAYKKMQRHVDVNINDVENERFSAKIIKFDGECYFVLVNRFIIIV